MVLEGLKQNEKQNPKSKFCHLKLTFSSCLSVTKWSWPPLFHYCHWELNVDSMLKKCVNDGFWRHSPRTRSFHFWSGKTTGGCLQIFKTTSGCLLIALWQNLVCLQGFQFTGTAIASQSDCLFQDTWSQSSGRASGSGPQKPCLRPDVHTRGDSVDVCRPLQLVARGSDSCSGTLRHCGCAGGCATCEEQ